MRALFKRHPIASTGFVLACAVTLFFLVRLVLDTIYWADPAHRDQTPAPWMTPAYVAHSWNINPRDLRAHLNLKKDEIKGRPTLKRIAQYQGIPLEQLIAELTFFLESQK